MLLMCLIMDDEDPYREEWSDATERRISASSYGVGRGNGKRKQRMERTPTDVYLQFQAPGMHSSFRRIYRFTMGEFDIVYQRMSPLVEDSKIPSVLPRNKILMTLQWIHHYPDYASLSLTYGISPASVSRVIRHMMPILAEFFRQFVTNKLFDNSTTSRMSNQIVAVVDATIHKSQKPSVSQAEEFNGHYKMHGVLTHILCDYDGYIIAFVTNVSGRIHDSQIGSTVDTFKKILKNKFSLGDPGFSNVANVVSGYRNCDLPKTDGHKKFDRIGRHEQIVVEHINCWIKQSITLDKSTKFRHSRALQVMAIFIVCGIYNYKKLHGYNFN